MNYKNQKINRIKLNLHYFCLFVVFSFIACSLAVKAAPPDAIAIRVIPNNGHQSAFNWYKSQAFQGSPQLVMAQAAAVAALQFLVPAVMAELQLVLQPLVLAAMEVMERAAAAVALVTAVILQAAGEREDLVI